MAATPQFVNAPNVGLTKFVTADNTTVKTVFTPASSGSRILALFATSNDTASRQFTIYLTRGGVRYQLDTFTIPGASSTQPTQNWNILDAEWMRWLDPNDPHLILPAGTTIEVGAVAAVTSGKEVSVIVMGGDF